MPRRALIPNPPWIDKILRKHWDAIQSQVGKDLMPVPAQETAGFMPVGGPRMMLLPARPEGESRYEQLGMGHYGAVFETGKDGTVLKVTSDPDEARFVVAALSLDRFPVGIVRYYNIIRLPETFRRRPVYAIWREEAERTGDLLPERELLRLPSQRSLGMLTAEQSYLLDVVREFEGLLSAWLSAARAIREVSRRTKDRARFWAKIRDAQAMDYRNMAMDFIEGVKQAQRGRVPVAAGMLDRHRGITRIAIALDAAQITAELMEHTYGPHNVGEALGFYLEREILLADVHTGNVGEVIRDGEGEVVITDPGHAVFLSDRYEGVLAGMEDPQELKRKVRRMIKKQNPCSKRALFHRLMRI